MCKVMILTNGSKIQEKQLNKVINKSAELITISDDDGFGWMASGVKGNFGERTTLTENFKTRRNYSNVTNKLLSLPFVERTYEALGDFKQQIKGALMFHGRTSTNTKNLVNTHPITKNGWSIIHNGVVTNQGAKYDMETTNDTEHLIHFLSTEGIKGIEENLSGYYAFGALDVDGNLHLAKDSSAGLTCSYIPVIDSYIYATTKDLIEDLCKDMKWKFEPIALVKNDSYIIFQGNEVKHSQTIEPMGWMSQWESDKASTSLHYLKGSRATLENTQDYESGIVRAYSGDNSFGHTTERNEVNANGNILDLITNIESRNESKSSKNVNNKVVDLREARREVEESKASADYDDALDAQYLLEEMEEYSKYYTIYDKYDREITHSDYTHLDTNDKLQCLLIDPVSGYPVDPYKAIGY